jgi:tRNA pseudouridine55 synthase
MQLPDNILLIDKPAGITSFDVIRILKREHARDGLRNFLSQKVQDASLAGEEGVLSHTVTEPTGEATQKFSGKRFRMGHAGTLDPLATGLMIVGVGSGTKKLTEYIKLDKEYIAEILVGERRSTGDMEGEIMEECAVAETFFSRENKEKVTATLADMVGILTLPVSAYSAIKKDGVPMYKRARKAEKTGEVITDVPERAMTVYEAELLSITNSTVNRTKRAVVSVRFAVGSGTYIRSLAEELGRRLGYPATLAALRRTKIGAFKIEDAKPLNNSQTEQKPTEK